jgi:hypothetical protein
MVWTFKLSNGVDISARGDIFGYFRKSLAIFLQSFGRTGSIQRRRKKILRALLEKK